MRKFLGVMCVIIAASYLSCSSSQQQSGSSNKAQRIKDGPGEIVLGQGTIIAKGNFKAYKKEGKWVQTYVDTRSIQGEGEYKNDQQHGKWKFYHKNGKLFSEGDFVEGQRTGEWVQYYNTGEKEAEFNYAITTIAVEGIGETLHEKIGALNGMKRFYHKDGKVKREEKYAAGKKSGIVREYFEDGRPKEMAEYSNDQNDGRSNTWWPSGKTKDKGAFRNGKKVGEWNYYHPNGAMNMTGRYQDDAMIGRWKHYAADGRLQKEGDYKVNDVVIKGKSVKRSAESGLWKVYRYNGYNKELAMEVALSNGMIDNTKPSKIYQGGKLAGTGVLQIGLIKGIYEILRNGSPTGKIPSSAVPPDEPEKNITHRWTGDWEEPKRQGQWKEFFPNGKLRAEGEYMVGRKNGIWKVYNADGSENTAESGNYMMGRKQ